jgi:steroid delta-isomerase-like uncharacterized protein
MAITEAEFRRIWDGVWHSKESASVIRESYADAFAMHITSLPNPIDRETLTHFVAGWQEAFPDGRMEIHNVTVNGDNVWCYWTSTGTHSDTYLNIPATGNKVAYQGMDLYYFENGKVVKIIDLPDALTLLRQLGALPA